MRTTGASGTIARTNLPVMIVYAASATDMLAEHAAAFNGAFDSTRARASIWRVSHGGSHEQCGHPDRRHRRHRHDQAQQGVDAHRLGCADTRGAASAAH